MTSRARSSRPIPSTSKADTQVLIRRGDGLLLRAWLRRSIRRHLGAIRRRSSSLLDHPRLTDARRYLTPLLQLPDDWRSPYARFWLELVGGALALLAAAWLFGILAEDVATGDRVTLVDEVLVKWLYAHATPAVTRAMLVVTELGGSVVVASLTLVTAALPVSMRRWPWVLTFILVVPGGALLNELLKVAFQRARPKFDIPILVLKDYGFPSGHTMIATLLYGLLAVLLVRTLLIYYHGARTHLSKACPLCGENWRRTPRSHDRWSTLTTAGSSRRPWPAASIIATVGERRKLLSAGLSRPR